MPEIRIVLTAGGTSADITNLVPAVSWSGSVSTAARTLDFSIVSSSSDKNVPETDCPVGANVQLLLASTVLFDGFIISRTKSTESSSIDLSCFDRGFYLTQNQANKKYRGVTPEEMTSQLASEFGITCGALAETGFKFNRNFFGVSLYDIIATGYTLASASTGKAYHIGFEGASLCVREKIPGDKTLIVEGCRNLMSAITTESIQSMVNAVAIYDTDNNFLRLEQDAQAIQAYGTLQRCLTQSKNDDKSAQAKKLLSDGGLDEKITVNCLGNTANTSGGCVVVRESYTGLFGLFWIDSDVHEWKRGQYYNKLTLTYKNIMDEKQAGSLPNADGSKTAASSGATAQQGAEHNKQYSYIYSPSGTGKE